MIETSDIYRSIRLLLEKAFPDIKVQIKDIKNPAPPCFYIKYVNDVNTQTASEYINDSIIFDVIYFSEKETLQDLLSIEKQLKKLFSKPLKIEIESSVQYQEIESISINLNENDYILNCTLNIQLDQKMDEENRYDEYENDETMEELEI